LIRNRDDGTYMLYVLVQVLASEQNREHTLISWCTFVLVLIFRQCCFLRSTAGSIDRVNYRISPRIDSLMNFRLGCPYGADRIQYSVQFKSAGN
jgi:hypothetical protein